MARSRRRPLRLMRSRPLVEPISTVHAGFLGSRAFYFRFGVQTAVREGDWKLIEWYDDGKLELFNLKDDLSEKTDLAKAHPEKVKALHELLVAEGYKLIDDSWESHGRRTYIHDDDATREFIAALAKRLSRTLQYFSGSASVCAYALP